MSKKPSLHEIAAMPFPASEQALLKWYGVKPRREQPEGELKTFKVRYEYSERIDGTATYTVEAVDEEHAELLANEMFDKDIRVPDDVELDRVEASEVTQ